MAFSVGSAAAWAQGGAVEPEVIYGDDNRKDLYDETADPAHVDWARSTAALLFKAQITPDPAKPGFSKVPTRTFGEAYNLCTDEPFRTQPNPAFCSGFLVAPDVLVTAGHCIEDASGCAETAFVFDYGYLTPADNLGTVKNSNVYTCKRIIAREQPAGAATDYAVIQLDRAVVGREPLKYRKEGKIGEGAGLVVIGHPAGLPTKIADGARVRSTTPTAFFTANLDTYGGNSGSAVFNAATGEVEGILVRGETDFVNDGTCRRSYRCPADGCRGEDVTRATEFAKHVPGAGPVE